MISYWWWLSWFLYYHDNCNDNVSINSLFPGRCSGNFKNVILEHMLWIKSMITHYEIVIKWNLRTLLMISQHWLDVIMHQAITWANAENGQCCHMTSLGHNEFWLLITSPLHGWCTKIPNLNNFISIAWCKIGNTSVLTLKCPNWGLAHWCIVQQNWKLEQILDNETENFTTWHQEQWQHSLLQIWNKTIAVFKIHVHQWWISGLCLIPAYPSWLGFLPWQLEQLCLVIIYKESL